MNDLDLRDALLKNNLEKQFVINKSNLDEPQVLAAMITAASKMAKCTDNVDENMVVDEILDLYRKAEDVGVTSLIGMAPQYVRNNIGYAVDFNDYNSAIMAYKANVEAYDKIYYGILKRSEERNQSHHL